MQTLLIILIVTMIAQTVLFIISNFIERNREKQAANATKLWEEAQHNFFVEKEQMRKNCDAKDAIIKQWIDKCNKLDFELSETRKVNGLLKNRVGYIECLKESFNQQAESEWESNAIFAEAAKKSQRLCYVEGMKAGAEWICQAVGVKVEFEIDGRFEEGDKKKED